MRATSITHVHLLAVVNSELSRWRTDRPVRILDVGCGNGRFLTYLAHELTRLHPGLTLELYGFDVHDHGVQAPGFLDHAIALLSAEHPEHPWRDRIVSSADGEPWPFADDFFDAIVSNQVLEHVRDHGFFLREVRRTLAPGGMSVHLFPLRHYIYEGHLLLPFAHRFRTTDLLAAYIRACSRLGLGKYREHRRHLGISIEAFAERHADYMHYFTNYLTGREVVKLAKAANLRVSFRYTVGFYTNKLRALVGLAPRLAYRTRRSATLDAVLALLLRYVSSVTLRLEKKEIYTRS